MPFPFSTKTIMVALSLLLSYTVIAQNNDTAYLRSIKERAYKIAAPLGISDSAKFYRVQHLIAQEYINIKKIDDDKEAAIKIEKEKNNTKEEKEKAVNCINATAETKRDALNTSYIKLLSAELSNNQIEKIKDGMTYNVLPITYKAHLDMIPSLKPDEKKYIYDALVEAREHAMAAGSSKAKHAWFGKYKGRINNYLAAKGYDLKKERMQWQERIKAH